MNNKLIEKIIKTGDEECPELIFENPLIDQKVTMALSKSFVKLLKESQSSAENKTNLRFSILETIRNLCKTEPDDHIKIEGNVAKTLFEFYCANSNNKNVLDKEHLVKKDLEASLLRIIEDSEISSYYKSNLNPEVAQSLINLNQNQVFNTLSDNVIHWDINDSKCMSVVRKMFQNEKAFVQKQLINDISIKLKPEIEKLFLEACLHIIENNITDLEDLFSNNDYLKYIARTCAVSSKLFIICSSILNSIFITCKFNIDVRNFISMFIESIKSLTDFPFAVLYPTRLRLAASILHFDLEPFPLHFRKIYIKKAVYYLKRVHENNEIDLIMLLSHFPNWFDIYFDPEYYF